MITKALVVLLSFTLCSALSARAETLEWIRQLGTSENDLSLGVSADGLGSVYISGGTEGSLEGTNVGDYDAFISKYDASGMLEWTRQIGTSNSDRSSGVSADGLGSVYISGGTEGSLEGINAGESDVFICKYDASGTLKWTRQLGTSSSDRSTDVSADGLGNVYITGSTEGSLEGTNAGGADAFLSKYDASGTLMWTRQLGTSENDSSLGVSADGLGSVYISGRIRASGGAPGRDEADAFLSKYDGSGTLEWTRELGTSRWDQSGGVSADGLGSVYMSGYTYGSLDGMNAGWADAFVSKYDASGTLEWTRQFGTRDGDFSHSVSADRLGSVYISGGTEDSLGGTNAGRRDAFLSKYDASGTLMWTQQFGSSEWDGSAGVRVDGLGSVYLTGTTRGTLVGTNAGGIDVFVAKFTDFPEALLGDVNLDGEVNGLDVDPFVEVLLSGPYQVEADMNEDQVVNGLDVDSFVDTVVGGGTQHIPEPSTLLLCIVALGVVGGWWKWPAVCAQPHGKHTKICEEWVGQLHRYRGMSANSTSATSSIANIVRRS